jgi:hypothetical protein
MSMTCANDYASRYGKILPIDINCKCKKKIHRVGKLGEYVHIGAAISTHLPREVRVAFGDIYIHLVLDIYMKR